MDSLLTLWLPVLASAAAVFIASSIFHMFLPIHKKDYDKLPHEEEILAFMREKGVKPGTYMFPGCASMKDLAEPETVARFDKGPVGWMRVTPDGMPTMGKPLLLWFLYCLGISGCLAFVMFMTTERSVPHIYLFNRLAILATLAYCSGAVQESIWKSQPWATTFRFLIDGVVYGLATAGVLAWLWPVF